MVIELEQELCLVSKNTEIPLMFHFAFQIKVKH